jgi:hypothetical protein
MRQKRWALHEEHRKRRQPGCRPSHTGRCGPSARPAEPRTAPATRRLTLREPAHPA